MFEYVLVQATGRTVRPYTVLVSFLGQMGLISLGILLPLVYTDVLPRSQWAGNFFAPQPPPGNAGKREVAPRQQRPKAPSPTPARPGQLVEPTKYPDRAREIVDIGMLPDVGPTVVGGTGDPMVPLSPSLKQATASAAAPPPPVQVKAPAAAEPHVRYRVGGLVSAPKPLHTPRPVYPAIAQQTRTSGVVHLEAVINTDGSVRSIRALQGHPWLVSAAIEAVREWRYTPPMLNGNPIELVMQIDVSFVLGR
jgi:protein TonB